MIKKLLVIGVSVTAVLYYLNMDTEDIIVEASLAHLGQVEQTINNSRAGSIKACQRSKLSMPIGGRVAELHVKQGDQVVAGQTLLKLWNDDQKALLKQRQAQLEATKLKQQEICFQYDYATSEANRQTALDKQKLTTQHNVDQALTQQKSTEASCEVAKVQVKQAEASVDMQQAILQQTVLTAPFAGVIAEINGEVGEFVTPSPPGVPTPPAVDLINTDCFYVTTPIDEIDASQLTLGQKAKVSLDAFVGRTFDARLIRIAPYVQELERQARTVDIDLELVQKPTDTHLLIGYSADAKIILSEKQQSLRIPTQAIMEDNMVFVVNQHNVIEQREIGVGIQNWTWTEITSGLSEGERVVTTLDLDTIEPDLAVQQVILNRHD